MVENLCGLGTTRARHPLPHGPVRHARSAMYYITRGESLSLTALTTAAPNRLSPAKRQSAQARMMPLLTGSLMGRTGRIRREEGMRVSIANSTLDESSRATRTLSVSVW